MDDRFHGVWGEGRALAPVIPLWQLPVLFATALAAGFVDAIAGGGGLITLPVFLGLGLPPAFALGTNKLQATFGSGSAAWHYARAGAVSPRDCLRPFLLCLVGAALGSRVVEGVDPLVLKRIIPVLLLAVGGYMFFKPELGTVDARPLLPRGWFEIGFGLGLGFYDGFFGPGTGTFWTMAYVVGQGQNLTRATAHSKVVNFASNLGSLAVFVAGGKVLWLAGLTMGVGQLLGARLGAGMVMSRGTRLIRPVFLTAVLAITLKVLWDAYFKR